PHDRDAAGLVDFDSEIGISADDAGTNQKENYTWEGSHAHGRTSWGSIQTTRSESCPTIRTCRSRKINQEIALPLAQFLLTCSAWTACELRKPTKTRRN